MSKFKIGTCHCPGCNSEIEFTEWESINVDLNLEEKEKILTGNFGKVICQSCNAVSYIQYPFLYHDMECAYMIGVRNNYSDAARKIGIPYGYKTRTVSDYAHLVEKIKIFDDGINDVVLEFIKEIIRTRLKLNSEEEILYLKTDHECLYFENCKNGTAIKIQKNVYSKLLNEIADPEDIEDDYFCKVDRKLILNAFGKM